MRRSTVSIGFVLAFIFGLSTMYGGPVIWIDDAYNNLGKVDIATGAVTMIGTMGSDTMTDIAFDPTGNLFGISFTNLYRIKTSDFEVSLIGPLGFYGANALVFGTNGTLYTAGYADKNLYTVDTGTGLATIFGYMGYYSAGDLAFNSGNFYLASGSNHLVSIDLENWAVTDKGAFGFANVFGLATGDNGVLYGLSGNNIFSINTATGAGTLVKTYENGLSSANGEAFFAEARAVPEPTSLILLGTGLGVIGLAAWRRRK